MLNTIIHGSPNDLPPLVIAHGLFGSARNWGVIAKRLGDSRQVIAVDMRNHGDSPWFDSQSYADMAADLADVIRTLTGGKADVLGHSMGGKAAMVLALTVPEVVNRLLVADIAPVTYSHSQNQNIEAMRRVDLGAIESRQDALRQLSVDNPSVGAFLLQSLDMKARRWKLNLEVLEREMPKIIGFPDVSATFAGRTLFLSGAASGYVRAEHREGTKALFLNSIFAKIPEAGHWLHAEKPREFEAAARTFFA